MMKKPIFVLLIFLSTHLFSQRHEFGIDVGANTYSFVNKSVKNYYSNLIGWQQSLTYCYNFNQKHSLSLSVGFLRSAYRFNASTSSFPVDSYTNNLFFPLIYKFNFTKKHFQPYLQLGFIQKALFSTRGVQYENTDTYYKFGTAFMFRDNVWHSDIAMGTGIKYLIGDNIRVNASFLYSYTFAMINSNRATTSSSNNFPHPNTYFYSIGISYLFLSKAQ